MIFKTYIPKSPLSKFVQSFWYRSGFDRPQAKEMLLPDGAISLIFNLRDSGINIYTDIKLTKLAKFSSAIVCGPYLRPFVIDRSSHDSYLGVQFCPGGSVPFLGIPADEITNTHLSLESIWGSEANELLDDLLEEQSMARRFHILEKALIRRLTSNRCCRPAVTFALSRIESSIGGQPIAEIAQSLGISHKRLIDVFKSDVGMTPRKFCRIKRFNSALERISQTRTPNWITIALDCGYFDQAHFNHDFIEICGLKPSCYFASRGNGLLHVRIVEWV